MQDLYQILGLDQNATQEEIRRAYRRMSLNYHPDRGGNEETMKLVNLAYETLSDPQKRGNFDSLYKSFEEKNVDSEGSDMLAGFLQAADIPPFSYDYRKAHQSSILRFRQHPLQRITVHFTQPFESGLYIFKTQNDQSKTYHDIFSFLRAKGVYAVSDEVEIPSIPITPKIAIELLINFLKGMYSGVWLLQIIDYMQSQMRLTYTAQRFGFLLYEGILELLLVAKMPEIDLIRLLSSLKKITDFAKSCTFDAYQAPILHLFHNQYFRNLHAYALNLYWENKSTLFTESYLKQFNGREEAEELLNIIRSMTSNAVNNVDFSSLVRQIKLLYNFDKASLKITTQGLMTSEQREEAFRLLDWFPALFLQGNKAIIANTFFQIALKFQLISQAENNVVNKMADEKLALDLYLIAYQLAHEDKPNMMSYVNNEIIKCIRAFRFEHPNIDKILSDLTKQALMVADIFPFTQFPQSNIGFIRGELQMLHLMRNFLQTMMSLYEYNKTHNDGVLLGHSASTLFYQAYEACLKNWYQEEYDPNVEKKLRTELMEELLLDNGWTSLDVEQNIDSPWIMVARNEEGWLMLGHSLPYTEDKNFVKYRAINGAEINHKTGVITFFMTPWTNDWPDSHKVFTLFDLQQMLEKNLAGAIFSLDPVEANKPYHPFNRMTFSPQQLCGSELLSTMLLTDYILKFLTTFQEVQGRYPFEQRSAESMIEHLPEHLRKIIIDFREAKHSGAVHRFWIEADEMKLVQDTTVDAITRISLGELTMKVKTHRMERGIDGELKDADHSNEGWPIYILTSREMSELEKGDRKIDGHAMIFIEANKNLFYWENDKTIHTHVAENYNETLKRLFLQPRNSQRKVEINKDNWRLLFRVTCEMAQKSNQDARYSPEFIFAQKFTIHYNEFSQYLPEFRRLKELCKITALIKFLNLMRKSNEETLCALDFLLGNASTSTPPMTEVYHKYQESYRNSINHIVSVIRELKPQLASTSLKRKWQGKINELKNEVGVLNFNAYSEEVNQACERYYSDLQRKNPRASNSQLWEHINSQRPDIAKTLSESKQESVRKQLHDVFSSLVLSSLGSRSFANAIDAFMKGSITILADALSENEKSQALQEIHQQFPASTPAEIASAIEETGESIANHIAQTEARRQLKEVRDKHQKLASGFVEINLGKQEEPEDLEGRCFWVPASIRHEVKRTEGAGASLYSFFVYGGVNLQPRINIIPGQTGPLGGNPVGGGSFNRTQITQGFQNHHIISDKNKRTHNHELLQLSGIDIHSRVNKIFLPSDPSLHPTRSLHQGRHTDTYSKKIQSRMDDLVKLGQAAGWTESQYRAKTRELLTELRQDLRAGHIGLNKNLRPWAKKW